MENYPRSEILCSIVIPVHNGMPDIAGAIQSVLPQLGPQMELVIFDNCSSDGTREFLGSMRDSLIVVKHSDVLLPIDESWSRAVSLAQGKWVKILPADDELLPDCLSAQLEIAQRYPLVGLVTSRRIIRSPRGKIRLTLPLRASELTTHPPGASIELIRDSAANPFGETSSALFRADLLAEILPLRGRYTLDLDTHFRLAQLEGWVRTAHVASVFQISARGLTRQTSRTHLVEMRDWMIANDCGLGKNGRLSFVQSVRLSLRTMLRSIFMQASRSL